MIYFIQKGDAVKIGFTAGDPQERLRQLQTGNHEVLTLIGTREGNEAEEDRLHKQFEVYKTPAGNEWFWLVPSLQEFIGTGLGEAGRGWAWRGKARLAN